VADPVYFGGPLSSQAIVALVERKQSPGGHSFELMPGLYAAVDEETVDHIIRTESDHARFVAGLVVWRGGEFLDYSRLRRRINWRRSERGRSFAGAAGHQAHSTPSGSERIGV